MARGFGPTNARLLSAALCLLLMQPVYAESFASVPSDLPYNVDEAASILGVTSNVRRLLTLREERSHGVSPSVEREILSNKSIILKKVLLGYLEVRQASDVLDVAIDYTYDSIDKVSRKRDLRVELTNIANFTQYGVFIILGACAREKAHFKTSGQITCIAAGNTLVLSTLAMLLGSTGRSRDACPANALGNVFGLNTPVDCRLPDLIDKFLNSTPNGSSESRRARTLDMWKTRFHVDASNQRVMTDLAAFPQRSGGEPLSMLRTRLALLYSLNATVEEFDKQLLALLRLMESVPVASVDSGDSTLTTAIPQLSADANEAAELLNIQSAVRQLIDSRAQASDDAQVRLQLLVLEKVLGAALEVRSVVDRVDQDKHYDFDVVLAEMEGNRNRAIRGITTLNFTQTGVIKAVAGDRFLNGQSKVGTKLIMTLNGIGILLSAVALKYAPGGQRKIDSDTNVLADFMNLDPPEDYRLSPLMRSYFDNVAPGSGSTLTRRQRMIEHWKEHRTLSSRYGRPQMDQLAAMPSVREQRVETIGLVQRRLRMLFDVRAAAQGLDGALLDLVQAVDRASAGNAYQLARLREALVGALEVRRVTGVIDDQLATEYTAQQEMIARSNLGIQLNNMLNFTQNGTFGLLSGGLVLDYLPHSADKIDMTSGGLTLLLASLAILQTRGGGRHDRVRANVLGEILGLPGSTEYALPAPILAYLNEVPPGSKSGLTRREQLIDRWKKAGVLTINLNRRANLEKLAANGPTHHPRSETIKLIQNRIVMLHDVHTLVESLDSRLAASLQEVN